MQFRICFSFHKRVVMWIINSLWWLKRFFLYKEIWIGEKVSFIYNVKIIVINFVMRAYNTIQCHFTRLAQNWITPKPDSIFFCTLLYHYAKTLKIISILISWAQICWCYLQHADMHAYPYIRTCTRKCTHTPILVTITCIYKHIHLSSTHIHIFLFLEQVMINDKSSTLNYHYQLSLMTYHVNIYFFYSSIVL